MNRFQGFPQADGLWVLDTVTGELVFCTPSGRREVINPARAELAPGLPTATGAALIAPPLAAPPPSTPASAAPDVVDPRAEDAYDLPGGIDDLDREVVLTFPYPVARPYLDFLRERDPRLRCKLLVDTFTAVLKMWSLQVASEYLRAPEVRDAHVHKTLVRDLARPLISAWNLLIQRALPVLADAGVPPFSPELSRCYESLETRCKQRFLVSETYEDDAGQPQTRTKKLGKIQALIAYRNGLAHGFNQSPKQAQRDLDTYAPLLKEVLREGRFLSRYPLWHVSEGRKGTEQALGYRLMGARPSGRPEPVDATELDPKISPLFLKNDATGDALPLFAFFDVNEVEDGGLPGLGRDVFLFEGNTKTTVIYVSATGEHAEKASRFQHWQALLASKAVDVELLAADSLTFDALRGAARRVADQALEALVQSGKYLREASVDRADLAEHLGSFEYGKYGAFVLGGESGIGKSTLLARYVEARRDAGDAVAFYRASALPSADVSSRLIRDLGLAGMHVEDFLAAASPLLTEGRRFWLVIDAVNEFAGDVADLVRHLDQLVQQAAGYDGFRLVVSVRDGAYQRLPADARFGARGAERYYTVEVEQGGRKVRTPLVALAPVAEERVEALYEAYRGYRQRDPDDPDAPGVHRFRPTTAFAELAPGGSTRALLRTPLMARLVMEAFHRRALPSDLRSDQAMRLYLEHVVVEAGHPGGGYPARRRVLTHLVRELDRAGVDVVPRDALQRSSAKELRDAMLNAQRDSAYVQLLELGVLLEEWEGEACLVRFAFDRLFEFLLAELHDPRVQEAESAIALAARATGFKSLRGALEVILGRACEQGREALLIAVVDQTDAHPDEGVRHILRDVVAALLERLAREKAPAFERILAEMPKQPSAGDVDVLVEVADRLALLGEAAALDTLLVALIAEATALGEPGSLGRALLRQARRLDVRGDWQRGLEAFDAAAARARDAGDASTRGWARLLGADLRDRRGDRARAEEEMKEVLEAFAEGGDRWGEAEAMRALGILAWRSGRLLESESMLRSALAVARELGNNFGVAASLNNIGVVVWHRGDPAEAERLYRASLSINEEIGHRRGVAMTLGNLGNLVMRRGDLAEAEGLYRRILDILKEVGDTALVAMTLDNLGRVAAARGDLVQAEVGLNESLKLHRSLGSTTNIQRNAYDRGKVRLLRGEASAALFEEARAMGESIGTPSSRIVSKMSDLLLLLGSEVAAQEEVAMALEALREARRAQWVGVDPEEGPATPYLLAARWLRDRGDAAQAAAVAREALEEVGDGFWAYRAEAEGLVALAV
jgi:tetratricopeptide (TPR) repeat protein